MLKNVITLFLVLLLNVPCMSTELHVPSQYSTIAEAMFSANTTDTIVLAAGTYSGPGFINLDNSSGWYGQLAAPAGPKATIIDLEGNKFLVGSAEIEGITLMNGSTAIAGYIDVSNCRFENNTVALYIEGTFPTADIDRCEFIYNDTAIVADGPWNALISHCEFMFNDVGIRLYPVPENWLNVVTSTFSFNRRCFLNMGGAIVGDLIFYKNDTVGTSAFFGCMLMWENISEIPSTPFLINKEAAATFLIADPLFCDSTLASGSDVSVHSMAFPSNNSCGTGIIGGVSVGCGCGNADLLLEINVSDLTYIVAYLFRGGPAPAPIEAGETDGVLDVNVNDLTYLVSYLFKGGPEPLCP